METRATPGAQQHPIIPITPPALGERQLCGPTEPRATQVALSLTYLLLIGGAQPFVSARSGAARGKTGVVTSSWENRPTERSKLFAKSGGLTSRPVHTSLPTSAMFR